MMRLLRCLIVVGLLFISLSYYAAAHPPSDIELVYLNGENILQISMNHVSSDSREHFIRRIIIYKNGEEVEDKLLTKQTSAQGLSLEVPLQAKVGDNISIKAICNKAGFNTASIIIE